MRKLTLVCIFYKYLFFETLKLNDNKIFEQWVF
jgi:hypothetical protein